MKERARRERRARGRRAEKPGALIDKPLFRLALAFVAVGGTLMTIGLTVRDRWLAPDPNIAVCRVLDNVYQQRRSPAGSSSDESEDLGALRAEFVNGRNLATEASSLRIALDRQVESIDIALSYQSDGNPGTSASSLAFLSMMSSYGEVADACSQLGVRFEGRNANLTADGSISHDDALRFCSAAHEYLTSLPDSTPNDKHLQDSTVVMTNYMDRGLPPEVYLGAVQLLMVRLAAFEGEGYPEGEDGMHTVGNYCLGVGATEWAE